MTSDYYKIWYGDNGQTLNRKRRDRYHTDPTYRQKVLGWNQQSRKNRKEGDEGEVQKERDASKIRVGGRSWKSIIVDLPGPDGALVATPVFSISSLAKVLGKSVQLVRIWEKEGKIPPPVYVSESKGDRFYSQEVLEELHEAMVRSGRTKPQSVRARSQHRAFERTILFPDGRTEKLPLFRVGALADLCDRTVVTMQLQESKGRIPQTPFRFSNTKYRLYTLPMMEAVKDALASRGGGVRGDEAWKVFHDEILQKWQEQGVVGASLADIPDDQEDAGEEDSAS